MSLSDEFPDETEAEVRQWLPPAMHADDPAGTEHARKLTSRKLPTAAELESIQQKAHTEGFDKGKQEGFSFGHKEGLAQARQQLQQYTERMEQLLDCLSEPLRELDDQVEQELLKLVIAIVRQLVRREVKSDPNLIVGVVREALSILPVASRNIRLLLHPEDAVLIREVYALADTEVGWALIEDPVVTRGGCKVVTDSSQIDATLDSRLNSLIAPLLAGARSEDDAQDEPL
ncbi:MAG: flagellar assembly protein FliH [Chromatiales bacterium]|jgi:flagellar assembly protein FliH